MGSLQFWYPAGIAGELSPVLTFCIHSYSVPVTTAACKKNLVHPWPNEIGIGWLRECSSTVNSPCWAAVVWSWPKEWNWCTLAALNLNNKKHRQGIIHQTFPPNPHTRGKKPPLCVHLMSPYYSYTEYCPCWRRTEIRLHKILLTHLFTEKNEREIIFVFLIVFDSWFVVNWKNNIYLCVPVVAFKKCE